MLSPGLHLLAVSCLLYVLPLVQGVPTTMTYSRSGDTFDAFNASNVIVRRANGPEWLRILPLGASIVRGLGSDPKDGFRKPLRDHLRSLGYKVNMVGSQYVNHLSPFPFVEGY